MIDSSLTQCIGSSLNASHISDGHRNVILPLGWGMGLTAALYVCGGVSGGHLNPAVTLGMASVGKISHSKIIHYIAGQYLGAFFGSLATSVVYYDLLSSIDGVNQSVNQSTTSLSASFRTTFFDQIVCVSLFLMIICAITDERNMNVSKNMIPSAIGISGLSLMIFAFGYNCGGPINPAYFFSSKLVMFVTGVAWDNTVVNDMWFSILGCHIGAIVGCAAYKMMIELHWPEVGLSGNIVMMNTIRV